MKPHESVQTFGGLDSTVEFRVTLKGVEYSKFKNNIRTEL